MRKALIKQAATDLLMPMSGVDLEWYTCFQLRKAVAYLDKENSKDNRDLHEHITSDALVQAAKEYCAQAGYEYTYSFIENHATNFLREDGVSLSEEPETFEELCVELRKEWLTWLKDTW